jgi:hypothetical protein
MEPDGAANGERRRMIEMPHDSFGPLLPRVW